MIWAHWMNAQDIAQHPVFHKDNALHVPFSPVSFGQVGRLQQHIGETGAGAYHRPDVLERISCEIHKGDA